MMKRAALAASALLALAACSEKPAADAAGAGGDKFAGLDGQIRDWRMSLLKERAECAEAPEDNACRSFEVACKGELPVSPEDSAAGVETRIVAAMTLETWDTARSEYRPSSAFAQFVKKNGAWTREASDPVNLQTCAAA